MSTSLDAPPSIAAPVARRQSPTADVVEHADAHAAALALVAAGLGVFPVVIGRDRKIPARTDWQHPADGRPDHGYTTDADTVRAWWGPRGRYRRHGVGIPLRDAGAFAIDLDDADAADGWASMVNANGFIDTFTVHSTKGAKIIMRRAGSPVPLDANGNKTRVPAFAGCTDVVAGYVLAWSEGRRWEGSPDVVAVCPAWLHAPLSTVYPPPPPPRPAPTASSTTSPSTTGTAMPWGRTWTGAETLARQCVKVANTSEGGRNAALHKAACAVYGFAHLSPLIDRNAEGDLLAAGRACGLDDAEALAAIRSGATWGRANPRTPSFGVIDDEHELDIDGAAVNRADAVAALARLTPSMGELAHLHPARRVTVYRVVGTLLATVAEHGRRVVVANVDDIAKAADVSRKTIAAAADDYAALGWTWRPGDAAERRRGCWAWGVGLSGTVTHGRGAAGERQYESTGVEVTKSLAACVAVPVGAVPDVLPLALRRAVVCLPDGSRRLAPRTPQATAEAKAEAAALALRLDPQAPAARRFDDKATGEPRADQLVPLDRLAGCGQWAAEAVAIVKAKPDGATGADVADALGLPNDRAARRALAAMAVRGILTSSPSPSTGGRPRLVYRYAPADAPLAAEHEVGERVYAKAVESAAARADRLADARVEAAETCEPFAVALARKRIEFDRRSAAERRAAAGGEIGIEGDRLERWAAQVPVAAASLFVPITGPRGNVVVMALPTVLDDDGKERIHRAATDRARAEWGRAGERSEGERRHTPAEIRGLALHYYAEAIRAVQEARDIDASVNLDVNPMSVAMAAAS